MQQTNLPDPDSIRRYLLGTSAPAEQQLIELRLLADRTFYDEVSAAEDELLDEYLDGSLAGRERESFDDIFLAAPERRQKLKFALALRRRAAESAGPSSADSAAISEGAAAATGGAAAGGAVAGGAVAGGAARGGFFGRLSPAGRAACAAIMVLAAAGAVLLAVRDSWQSHAPTPATPAADERAADSSPTRERPAAPVPSTRPDGRAEGAPAKTVAVTLAPGLTRGADDETRRVEITPDVGRVRLELLIASDGYPTYQATVRSVEGRAVCDLTGLAAESSGGAQAVFVEVPASSLAPDDYRVRLSGLRESGGDPEPLDSYFFRVPHP